MNYLKEKLSFAFVFAILGLLIFLQINSTKINQETADVLSVRRANELSAELDRVKAERDSLLESLDSMAAYKESGDLIDSELYNNTLLVSGNLEVEGQGVKVTLNDSTTVLNPDIDPNVLLIHDEDILTVVNELFASGAEAISINGQRLVSTSYVRCVGPVVNINGTRVTAPFIISAIGDAQTLETALKLPGGVVDSLTPWGINISINRFDNIVIPAFEGQISTKYIKSTIDKEDN